MSAPTWVASACPPGWTPGQWSQVNKTTWQETKLGDPTQTCKFQEMPGTGTPGSKMVRLKMQGGAGTEVLLLESSALVFVNGALSGEYIGGWSAAGGIPKPAPASKGNSKQTAPAPVPPAPQLAPALGNAGSAGYKAEITAAPAVGGKTKSAPPPEPAAPAPVSVPVSGPAPEFGNAAGRARKREGLDTSPDKIKKLMDAAKNGDLGTVKSLLEAGVDPDGPAADGRTPLMNAAASGSLPVVEALLAAGGDPNWSTKGETPLTIAFQKGKQDILKALFSGTVNSLDTIVGSGVGGADKLASSQISLGIDSTVPENALDDLRDMTSRLATINKQEPTSPSSKYGNYTHLAEKIEVNEYDGMQEEAVRLVMKDIVRRGE